VNNVNCPQFSLADKVFLCNKLNKFDSFFETLFGKADLTNRNELTEIMLRLNYDPAYRYEKEILRDQIQYFIQYGQFSKALLYYLLSSFQ
jgi:hypothetical protein